MKDVGLRAGVQVWVCVNEREEGARLPSCRAARGESIAQSLRLGLLTSASQPRAELS